MAFFFSFPPVIIVLMLLAARAQHNYTQESASARIIPSRLQLFEYSSISFDCDGFKASAGWTVMRKITGKASKCVSTWVTKTKSVCAIKPAYRTDSGEYWCEAGDQRSNTVNISVTAGLVMLESPAVPVVEGDDATLRCRSQRTSIAHVADFYKDDILIGSGSTGELTIRGVSDSDEGLYRCSISDFGESPQSWLAVRARRSEARPASDHPCRAYLLVRTVLTVVMVALLLLLVGLIHGGKLRVTRKYVCICTACKGRCQTEQKAE